MSEAGYQPRPVKRLKGGGTWVGVTLLVLVLVAVVVVGVVTRSGSAAHHTAGTTTTLAPSAATASTTAPTTTTTTLPLEQTDAMVKAIPGLLPGPLVPIGTPSTDWTDEPSERVLRTPSPCIDHPVSVETATRHWILPGGLRGRPLGVASVSFDKFATAGEASVWLANHVGRAFLACSLRASRQALTDPPFKGRGTNDSNIMLPGLASGRLGVHYTAMATLGSATCRYYDDAFFGATGRYGVSARFVTCGKPIAPDVMQDVLRVAVDAAATLK